MSVRDLVRPKIRNLVPYRCARDDYSEGILLDANENTHGIALQSPSGQEVEMQLNRYPDPHQIEVKSLMCQMRNTDSNHRFPEVFKGIPDLTAENLCLGVGSDETIDSLIRALCPPGKGKLLICPPTYGMYTVSAEINDVEIVKVPLTSPRFSLNVEAVKTALLQDSDIKLVYLCSPGNPTGRQFQVEDVLELTNAWKGGVVAVDEAYVDFASGPSCAKLVNSYERLAVLQTLSKSFGLAGMRLGICFASKPLSSILNAMKAPYNISTPTSQLALRALSPEGIAIMRAHVESIKAQRTRLSKELLTIPGVKELIGGQDANFLLVRLTDANGTPSNAVSQYVYKTMAEKSAIVVRFRGMEHGCEGCLRVSIGTEQENNRLLEELRKLIPVAQSQ